MDVTGVITTDGLTTSADINFGDNDKAIFGAGKLDIHHDGSNNLIRDLGTGDSYIQTNNSWRFTDVGNNETHMIINDNGAIHLYYDNATKLSTTAAGVDVTGTVTADGLTVDGTGGQITTDNNGFITSKQSLDTITAGGRFIGKSNRGELGHIAIEQTATGADGGYIRFSTSPSGSTSPTERMRIKSDGTLQLAGYAGGANTLDASITAFNYGQSQVNSRIDFMTDSYQNSGQIKLRTAFGTTTKDGIIVDEQARVTMPYQPSFAASRNQGDVNNAVYVFPNIYHNTGSHYNSSNGRFTAPVTGSYFISTNMMNSNNGTYNNYTYEIRVNGNLFQYVYSSNGTAVHHRWNWSGVAYLQAGDYVEIYVPSNFYLYGGGNQYTHFSGYLLG